MTWHISDYRFGGKFSCTGIELRKPPRSLAERHIAKQETKTEKASEGDVSLAGSSWLVRATAE